MICQRCGYCCVTMDVFIRVGDRIKLKPHSTACPHLDMNAEDKTTSCAVHEASWYAETPMPCFIYGNPDWDPDYELKRGQPCRVGLDVMKRGGVVKFLGEEHCKALPGLEDWGAAHGCPETEEERCDPTKMVTPAPRR